ncbi:MAG: UDP-N-acetylmuramoyl-L-alanyl-D-glutamate--2,6-diaminopimelate ligase [Coriobacteriia bacterium]|nr:UDP-N-acetylmuramoyl-L-alanyl-D-glutamate--2,6-diaminopimelate ligase [Coriobacteriia bacterium]
MYKTHSIASLLCKADGSPYSGIIDLPEHLADCAITDIVHDSRFASPGSLFFAIEGHESDGHDYAVAALSAGADAVVAQKPIPALAEAGNQDRLILVADTRIALAYAAATFYGHPGKDLAITGVTGTNGKTTTIYLMDSIARAAGEQSGVIGTVETRYLLSDNSHQAKEYVQSCATTTPDALALQKLLAQMRDAGVQSVAMEVSSHAIDMHRAEQTPFAAVAFTNLSQDHLDYHHTMEEYRRVKERLFFDFEAHARITNCDDAVGAGLAGKLKAQDTPVITVGICESDCTSHTHSTSCTRDICASDLVQDSHMTNFVLHTPVGTAQITFPLIGRYNVENALVAAACAWSRGINVDDIAQGLSQAPQVPGRLQQVESSVGFKVFVDYAHTPDALATALAALREQTSGRVIAVFGCGGDRDPSKRPMMARAACNGSDYVVVTSDNPRSEDPASIVADVCTGLDSKKSKFDAIVDRREAIFYAVAMAGSGDSILIAGKGHEDYQIFADDTVHFDDAEVAREAIDAIQGQA